MNRLFSIILVFVFMMGVCPPSAFSQRDLTDYRLISYALSAEEEALFSYTDGTRSAFWAMWDSSANLDFIYESPYTHGVSTSLLGFEGEEDCNLQVRSAYGDNGLYLYLEVEDDQFLDKGALVPDSEAINEPGLNAEWMNDAVDFVIDRYSSEEQKEEDLYLTMGDQRTASYVQIQYRFGGQAGPSPVVRYSCFDPAWTGVGDPIKYSHLSVNELYAMGILFEVIVLDPYTKCQEWLIPWAQVGSGLPGKPEMGKKIAFITGYNDIDVGEARADILRWKNKCDAYCNSDNWGDLEFAGSLYEAAPVRRHLQRPAFAYASAPPAQKFSLTGQMIDTRRFAAKAAPCIIRYVEPDGKTKCEKMMSLR
jgi:hypothetical protein